MGEPMLTMEQFAARCHSPEQMEAIARDISDKLCEFLDGADPITRVHPLRRFWWKWQDRISTAWDVLRGRHECGELW